MATPPPAREPGDEATPSTVESDVPPGSQSATSKTQSATPSRSSPNRSIRLASPSNLNGSHQSGAEETSFTQGDSACNTSPSLHTSPIAIPASTGREGEATPIRSHSGTYQTMSHGGTLNILGNPAYGATAQHAPTTTSTGAAAPPLLDPLREEKMSLNIFILSSMGMLDLPGTSVTCMWIAVPFYLLLLLWGSSILTSTSLVIATTLVDCTSKIAPFAATMLGGGFFILLGLYWMLVYWQIKVLRNASRKMLMVLWFILAMVFVGTVVFLAVETYETKDFLIHKNRDNCSSQAKNGDYYFPHHYQVLPLLTLGSMILLGLVYVCVFLSRLC